LRWFANDDHRASDVSSIILVTVEWPRRKLHAMLCCESPVSRNRRVTAKRSAGPRSKTCDWVFTWDFQLLSSLWSFPDNIVNINTSNAIALVFLRKQNMFLYNTTSRRRSRVHYTKKHRYTIAKQLHVDISRKNYLLLWYLRRFCFVVMFIFHCLNKIPA
jgi:hypothetical protein